MHLNWLTKTFFKFALIIILFCLSFNILYKYKEKKITPFHPDESSWIASGYYYSELIMKWDFNWQKWMCPECGAWGSLNPHLGKLLIGLPLKICSNYEFIKFYDFNLSLQKNEKEGRVVPDDILFYTRNFSIVLSALCCLLIFGVGYYSCNIFVGIIAFILLLTNKQFIACDVLATTDASYNFFLLLVCITSIFLFKNQTHNLSIIIILFYGICTALVSSIKITGFIISISLFVIIICYNTLFGKCKIKELLKYLLVFFMTSIFFIYALNPCFWPSLKKVELSELIKEIKKFNTMELSLKLESEITKQKYPQLSNISHIYEFPLLFVRWKSLMEEQQKVVLGRVSMGFGEENRLLIINKNLLWDFTSFSFEYIFFAIGIIAFFIRTFYSFNNKQFLIINVPFFYFIINYLLILIFMKLNWLRYYVPTIIASKFIVAYGIYEMCRYFYVKTSLKEILKIKTI